MADQLRFWLSTALRWISLLSRTLITKSAATLMKILHVITQSEFGGAQRHVRDLTRWQRRNHEVEVACGGTGRLVQILIELGVRTHTLTHLKRPIRPAHDVLAMRQLVSLFRAGSYDIVHCHSTKAGLLGRAAARLASVPRIVFTAHGFAFNEPGNPVRKRAFAKAELAGSALCDKIIAVSHFDYRSAIRIGILADRVVVVHNGVFPEDLPDPAEVNSLRRLGVPQGAKCVLAIGYFYKNKGFSTLIQAASGLSDDVHIVIIGDGPEVDSAKALISRLRLNNRVHLPGALPNAGRFLALADVVAIPSLKEGLPYVLLEAMASARPVVATRVGGIPEAIVHGQSGLLVNPGDPAQLRAALLKFFEDTQYACRLAGEGQATVARSFQGALMCERTDDVYASLGDRVPSRQQAYL